MLKRFEIQGLQADLAAVTALLAKQSEEHNPITWHQFLKRQQTLQRQLAQAENVHIHSAGVALFFGGLPVVGSRGIAAGFGAKAVEQFQSLVTTQFGALERPLPAKGPIKGKARAQFMVTDVVRGSFGFLLEEIGSDQLVDTPLKSVVDQVLDFIAKTGADDPSSFEEAAEHIDNRVLTQLKSFFKMLNDNGATIRLVENEREVSLGRQNVTVGRERIDNLNLTEEVKTFSGQLFYVPKSGHFNLYKDGEVLAGRISADGLAELTDENGNPKGGIVGTQQNIRVRARTLISRGREPKTSYTLVGLG